MAQYFARRFKLEEEHSMCGVTPLDPHVFQTQLFLLISYNSDS